MKKIYLTFLLIFLGLNSFAQQYKFDSENRIVKIIYLNGQEVDYSYDNEGNRKARSSNSIVTIEEIVPNDVVNVYPNPYSYELNIQFIYIEYDEITIEFTSSIGEKILIKQISEITENSTQIIDVLALPIGSYFLQILSENEIILSEKVIISDKI